MVLFATSYDHFQTAQILKRFTTVGPSGVGEIVPGAGRCGSQAMLIAGIGQTYKGINVTGGASVNKGFFGTAFKLVGNTFGTGFWRLITEDGLFWHLLAQVTASGAIKIFDFGGNVLVSTANDVVHTGEYLFVEIGFVISNTIGEVTLRVNNVQLAHATGLDTQAGASNVFSAFALTCDNNAAVEFDDTYFCDDFDDGKVPATNTFLGDVHCEYVRPESDGNYVGEWAVVGGGTQHNAVDKGSNPTATSPSLQSLVSGDRATNNYFASAVVTGSVFNVGVHMLASKSDAGPVRIAPMVRRAGVDAVGSDYSPPLSASIYESQEFNRDPTDATAWTIAHVNAAEFGVKDTR